MARKWELPKIPEIPVEPPHRVVDKVLDGVADSAKGVITSVMGGLKGAGKGVADALDKPFQDLTGKSGPHRIVDRFLDGSADAIGNFWANGVIGSMKTFGKGCSKALDHPWEQLK